MYCMCLITTYFSSSLYSKFEDSGFLNSTKILLCTVHSAYILQSWDIILVSVFSFWLEKKIIFSLQKHLNLYANNCHTEYSIPTSTNCLQMICKQRGNSPKLSWHKKNKRFIFDLVGKQKQCFWLQIGKCGFVISIKEVFYSFLGGKCWLSL